jgi:hypothetical protein
LIFLVFKNKKIHAHTKVLFKDILENNIIFPVIRTLLMKCLFVLKDLHVLILKQMIYLLKLKSEIELQGFKK